MKNIKKLCALIAIVSVFLCALSACNSANGNDPAGNNEATLSAEEKENLYNEAVALYGQSKWTEAYEHFAKISDYKDTADYLKNYKLVLQKRIYINHTNDMFTNEYTYDEGGNLSKEVYTDDEGQKDTTVYSYDSDGKLLKKEFANHDGDTWKNEYTYDKDGKLLKDVYSYPDGDPSTTDYTYDANGNLLKKVLSDGKSSVVYEYTYDDGSKLPKEVCSRFIGSTGKEITDYTYYTYDADGNLSKQVLTDAYGNTQTTAYSYDGSGRLAKKTFTENSGSADITEYTYDANGNLLKERTLSDSFSSINGEDVVEYIYMPVYQPSGNN